MPSSPWSTAWPRRGSGSPRRDLVRLGARASRRTERQAPLVPSSTFFLPRLIGLRGPGFRLPEPRVNARRPLRSACDRSPSACSVERKPRRGERLAAGRLAPGGPSGCSTRGRGDQLDAHLDQGSRAWPHRRWSDCGEGLGFLKRSRDSAGAEPATRDTHCADCQELTRTNRIPWRQPLRRPHPARLHGPGGR
jgi:hypothetical protein